MIGDRSQMEGPMLIGPVLANVPRPCGMAAHGHSGVRNWLAHVPGRFKYIRAVKKFPVPASRFSSLLSINPCRSL